MNRIVFQTNVGRDGILHVTLPLGLQEADRSVQVTVEPVGLKMAPDDWRNFILATAGSIDDPTFERPEQGIYERRHSLA